MGAPDEHLQQELAKTMREGIGSLYKSLKTPEVVIGRAINVTDTLCDIDRGEGSPGMSGVRLNALEEATGTYATIVPKENSWVLVAVIEDDVNEGVIIATTEIEKIIFKCGANTTYLFTDGTIKSAVGNNSVEITQTYITAQAGSKKVKIEDSVITLNNSTNDGLVIDAKVLTNLNIIKTYATTLKTATSVAITALASALGVTTIGTAFDTAMAAVSMNFEDMKNPNVKH